MLPSAILIAEQLDEALGDLSSDDQQIVLDLIRKLPTTPINPDMGTYLSRVTHRVWIALEVIGSEVHVTDCGRHMPGRMM